MPKITNPPPNPLRKGGGIMDFHADFYKSARNDKLLFVKFRLSIFVILRDKPEAFSQNNICKKRKILHHNAIFVQKFGYFGFCKILVLQSYK
ncbi:hypothetical protein [Helicobacter sp. T3_23-1059]